MEERFSYLGAAVCVCWGAGQGGAGLASPKGLQPQEEVQSSLLSQGSGPTRGLPAQQILFFFPCSSWERGSILALSSFCHVLHEASDSTGLFLAFASRLFS